MKKLFLSLLALGTISAFATDLLKECRLTPTKTHIEYKVSNGLKFGIVHVYGEVARGLYSKINGDETYITEKKKDYVIKSEGNTDCFRQDRTVNKVKCAQYECEIGVKL